MSHAIEGVPESKLEHLILWPPGTIGEVQERQLVIILNNLCKKHGYGRVPQLAQAIEDLWRNPERSDYYEVLKEDHLKFMKECEESLKD